MAGIFSDIYKTMQSVAHPSNPSPTVQNPAVQPAASLPGIMGFFNNASSNHGHYLGRRRASTPMRPMRRGY